MHKDPFKHYYSAYENLIEKIKQAHSEVEFSKWMQEIHELMQAHFKEIMSFYDEQYKHNLNLIEQYHQHFNTKTQQNLSHVQDYLGATIQEAQDATRKFISNLENLHATTPKDYVNKAIADAHDNLSNQIEHWEKLYASQRKEVISELGNMQAQAQKVLQDCEKNRQEMLEKYKELTSKIQTFLKSKQQEFKSKK